MEGLTLIGNLFGSTYYIHPKFYYIKYHDIENKEARLFSGRSIIDEYKHRTGIYINLFPPECHVMRKQHLDVTGFVNNNYIMVTIGHAYFQYNPEEDKLKVMEFDRRVRLVKCAGFFDVKDSKLVVDYRCIKPNQAILQYTDWRVSFDREPNLMNEFLMINHDGKVIPFYVDKMKKWLLGYLYVEWILYVEDEIVFMYDNGTTSLTGQRLFYSPKNTSYHLDGKDYLKTIETTEKRTRVLSLSDFE